MRVSPTQQLMFRGFWKRFFFKYVLCQFAYARFLFAGIISHLRARRGLFAREQHRPQEASAGSVMLAVEPF